MEDFTKYLKHPLVCGAIIALVVSMIAGTTYAVKVERKARGLKRRIGL